jgi:hypothetical protein
VWSLYTPARLPIDPDTSFMGQQMSRVWALVAEEERVNIRKSIFPA